jgi:hypothetical protein
MASLVMAWPEVPHPCQSSARRRWNYPAPVVARRRRSWPNRTRFDVTATTASGSIDHVAPDTPPEVEAR